MFEDKQIEEVLADAFIKHPVTCGMPLSRMLLRLLPKHTVRTHISDITYEELETALAASGTILKCSEKGKTLAAIVYAGFVKE